LEEFRTELTTTTGPEAAGKLVQMVRQRPKSKKDDFVERVMRACDKRWTEKRDASEMLHLLERMATKYGLAPIVLKAYKSQEEVPRKHPEAIERQKGAA
jgi:hypothetical protein